jgi:hypothetical protein
LNRQPDNQNRPIAPSVVVLVPDEQALISQLDAELIRVYTGIVDSFETAPNH